jgi:hypothetical protein
MAAFEFDQLLRRAVDVARWAPSSHNAQPWRLTILPGASDAERLLRLSLDQTRRLTALDSLDLEMGLSIGMFLGLLVTGLETAIYAGAPQTRRRRTAKFPWWS